VQRETRRVELWMVEKMCQCGMRSTGRRWGQMSHHDKRGRTYSDIRE
jgi:hypothetical protein